MLVASLAGAQTIADYSHAQRAWLESTMSQAAVRSAGLAASTPPVATPAATSPAASASAGRRTMAAPEPVVQVSGVFAAGGGAVAQVMVDATAYLLSVGQGVPGTAWRVQAIAIDKVVFGRPVGAAATTPEGARKVFWLPALD
jgi:type IV pilus biogenesis protein PilP